jgi:hypothetical protein
MILKRADIIKLGVSKILIWSLDISHTKNLTNSCTLDSATKNLNFHHFLWYHTKSLKTSNKLYFNSVG